MQFTTIFLWAMALITAYTEQTHNPEPAVMSLLSDAKSDCVKPTNSTAHDSSAVHGNTTTGDHATTGTKSKDSSTKANDSPGGGAGSGSGSGPGMVCNCSSAAGGNSSGSGSTRNNSTNRNATKTVAKAAGYAVKAADAGGLVTIAGLGVAFALFM